VRRSAVALLLVLASCTPVVVPAGPEIEPPALTTDAIHAPDGVDLPLRSWLPKEGKPKAVILALHGMNDYSNFFDMPGTWLAGQGIASYAYDQRGFGKAARRGMWPGIETMESDARTALDLIRSRHPGTPLFLLGESMGGAVALSTMTEANPPTIDGLILSAPAVWGRSTMPFYQPLVLAIASHTVPWMTLTGQGLDIKPSDNIPMLVALGRDPLVIKGTRVDAIHGLSDLMDTALDRSETPPKVPTLILYGAHDEIIPPKPTRIMLEKMREAGAPDRVAVYENGYHMLLRDLQREVVWKDIDAWITDRKAPLPSGAENHPLPPDEKPKSEKPPPSPVPAPAVKPGG
jgi:acylglycerol lipase